MITGDGVVADGEFHGNQHRQGSTSQTRQQIRLQEVQSSQEPGKGCSLERNGKGSQGSGACRPMIPHMIWIDLLALIAPIAIALLIRADRTE
jgi:hypothetical protein